MLYLVAQNKMSLDDDVNKYLDVLWLQISDGLPARATVRKILSHSKEPHKNKTSPYSP
ncbi:MAG: hypothetical protein K2M46_12555 [Lachnospiraceae bacterium]|nr:hypothetical protein [Lachnospiraceae bacterium]